MNLSRLTGRYGASAGHRPKVDERAALKMVYLNERQPRSEIVKLLGRKHGISPARAQAALTILCRQGDLECNNAQRFVTTAQGILRIAHEG